MVNRVFFWAPNIVGYLRIAAMLAALAYIMEQPIIAIAFYALSQLLDAADGTIARYMNQCSQFGALLDMLTDRMSTSCLLIVIAIMQKEQWKFYVGLMVLDLVSHWAQMYSKLLSGGKSHKINTNPILKFYYSFPFLLIFCVGNELYIICTYLLAFAEGPLLVEGSVPLFRFLSFCSFPIFVGKNVINLVQLVDSCGTLAELDRPKSN